MNGWGGGGGTVGIADLYPGSPSRVSGRADVLGIQNPNGASVAPATQRASGGGTPASASGTGPAFAWIGLLSAFVVLRVLIHLSDRAD